MEEVTLDWREQFIKELEGYQAKQKEHLARKLRLNEIERFLEEGSKMWRFLFPEELGELFENQEQVVFLHNEYRSLKKEVDTYEQYLLEHSGEKDYFEGLKKCDTSLLSVAEQSGEERASYAMAYFLLQRGEEEGAVERLKTMADKGSFYARLRLAEYYEYKTVDNMGSKSCDTYAKEAMTWYSLIENSGNNMKSVSESSKERIRHVHHIQKTHMAKRKSVSGVGKVYRTIRIVTPIIAFLICAFWLYLQTDLFVKGQMHYCADGMITVGKRTESTAENVFGIPKEKWNYILAENKNLPVSRIEIPEGTVIIAAGTYEEFSGAVSLVIPEGVVRIEEGAFKGCTALEEIVFPSSLKYIGKEAFAGCTSLKTLDAYHTSLVTIGEKGFSGCKKLTNAYLPVDCLLEDNTFEDCKKKFTIHYEEAGL